MGDGLIHRATPQDLVCMFKRFAAVLLSIPILLMTNLTTGTMPSTVDAPLHYLRMIAIANDLHNGVLWPRWSPVLYLGYGYPLFIYYPPLASVLGGWFLFLGFSPGMSFLLVQTLAILIGVLGAYQLARIFGGELASLVAALLYLTTPYFLFNVFHQGSLSQLLAIAWLPWLLWAMHRGVESPSLKWASLSGLFIALLILTHHVTVAYFLPFAGLYIFVLFVGKLAGNWRAFSWMQVAIFGGYALGLLMAAIYLLPLIAEMDKIVSIQEGYINGAELENNFVMVGDVLGPAHPSDPHALILDWEMVVGIPQMVAIAGGFVLALLPFVPMTRLQRLSMIVLGLGSAVVVFLMTYHAVPMWETFSQMGVFQQPYRFLGLVTVAAVPGTAWLGQLIADRLHPVALAGTAGVILVASMPLIYPRFDREPFDDVPSPQTSIQYEANVGNRGSVAFATEYRPEWVSIPPDEVACEDCYEDWTWQIYPNTELLSADIEVEMLSSEHRRGTRFIVNTPEAAQFPLHQMYFPGWQATLNGSPVEIDVTEPHGLMVVEIPAGEHELEIWYGGTNSQRWGAILSGVGIVICIGLYVLYRRRQSHELQTQDENTPANYPMVGGYFIAGVVIFGLVNGLILEPGMSIFVVEGSADDPLYMENQLDVTLVDGDDEPTLELLGYNISADEEIDFGEWVYVTLYWLPLRELEENFRVNVELVDPVEAMTWESDDVPNPGLIPTSHWRTDKYVIDQHILRIDDNVPPYYGNVVVSVYNEDGFLTKAGETRVFLAGVYLEAEDAVELPENLGGKDIRFGDALTLHGYCVSKQDAEILDLSMYWSARRDMSEEFIVFVHYWDGETLLDTEDQPPIRTYPTYHWREEQVLLSELSLSVPDDATEILIGVYNLETVERLPASLSEQDNRDPNALRLAKDEGRWDGVGCE